MEYNVHDRYLAPMTKRVSYPHPEFFEIAAQEGVQMIIGLDAHEPQELSDPTQWDLAQHELKKYGELFIDHIALRGVK
jgi:histidinol-phosphatase (PHP family)